MKFLLLGLSLSFVMVAFAEKTSNLELRSILALKAEETDAHTIGILYNDVGMSNLVRSCFQAIPLKYREDCLVSAFERFVGAVFPLKARCCTKWHQMDCLEKYTFNSLYCDMHQTQAVSRYFRTIRSLGAEGSPECATFRPVREEIALWSSDLGRVPKCATAGHKEPYVRHQAFGL